MTPSSRLPATLLVLCLLPAWAGVFGQDTGTRRLSIPVPVSTREVAVSDFDGDGLDDIAAFSGAVDILRNDGAGGFVLGARLPAGLGQRLLTGDVDGDGIVDVAVGGGHTVTLGYGGADARGFGVWQEAICPARSVALGDLDSDGLLDIVAAGGGDGLVCIRLGVPGRRFAEIQELTSPILFPHAVATGDFNGDGILDIGVWGRQRGPASTHFVVYEGVGGGGFDLTEVETRALDPGGTPDMTMVAGDLDRDGDDELVLLIQPLANGRDRQGKLLVVNGRGRGQFSVGSLGYVEGSWVHLADLDSDGFLDLVISEGFLAPVDDRGAVTVFRGEAALTFGIPCRLSLSRPAGILATGDLDGDGRTDLALPLGDHIEVVFSPLEECVLAPCSLLPALYLRFYSLHSTSGPASGGSGPGPTGWPRNAPIASAATHGGN